MNESLETRVRRLEDLAAIQALFVAYGEQLDEGDFDGYAGLFAEDGELLLGPLGRAKGRTAIRDLMAGIVGERVGTTRHIVSSPRVTLAGDTAAATVMWTALAVDDDGRPVVSAVGHHVDELVRVDGRWCFQRRKGELNLPASVPF